ncbi:MAG: hypothetical protein R3B84_06480 [Zavarzinella sp.]
MSEHLFQRRQFLGAASVAGMATMLPGQSQSAEVVKIGTGKATYTLDPNWGVLPQGMKYGFGCAIVADAKDRIYVTTRSDNPCVIIFDTVGKVLETWSKEVEQKIGYTLPNMSPLPTVYTGARKLQANFSTGPKMLRTARVTIS